jgi:hypothetical protein
VRKRAVLLWLAATLVISAAPYGYAAPDSSDGDCAYPRPSVVLGRDVTGLDKVEYLGLEVRNRWMLISTAGPLDGVVAVIACDGRILAKRVLGYVEQATFGQQIGNRDTLAVVYHPGSGTGIDVQSVVLLQFDETSIREIWNHPIKDRASFPSSLWGGSKDDSRLRTETTRFNWNLALDGQIITVTGDKTVELGARITRARLPLETYCYRSDKRLFSACRSAQ